MRNGWKYQDFVFLTDPEAMGRRKEWSSLEFFQAGGGEGELRSIL